MGRGRPRKAGKRGKNDRLLRESSRFTDPPEHITEKRNLFSFVSPTKGPDGRAGEIDQDICDGIGMFHALGLLDGHPIDGLELRNIGREWRDFYTSMLRRQGFKAGGYERMDKAVPKEPRVSERLDRMDLALSGHERRVLMDLLVDPVVGSWPLGESDAPWVRGIIAEGLLKRGKVVKLCKFPDCHDRALFDAAVRGLFALHDASLPSRWERAA